MVSSMRVQIDRDREERKIATGRFAITRIPTYCLSLTVNFGEEERYLIRHTGICCYVFFLAPIPPDVTDAENIKKLKADDFRLFFVSDLLRFGSKALLAGWPDLIAANEGEAAMRLKLDELAEQLARAAGTTESSVVYEL